MFGVIGSLNVLLYLAIFNATMFIGAVKATVIATMITTTLSYLANRHWTYKHRPRSTLRREYTLFFAFNLVGMLIQAAVVGLGKYGLGFNEHHNRLEFNVATNVGIALATLFRFWAYRTLVFKSEPAVAVVDIPATPAPRQAPGAAVGVPSAAVAAPAAAPAQAAPHDEFTELTASLEAELAAAEEHEPRPLRHPLVTDSLVSD